MAAQYTYLATDLVTGTVLGELPVNNVSLDCQLLQPGNMSAGGKLSDKRLLSDEFIARTIPGKTAFWAYRDDQIVWGGIIWTREYQSNGKSLSITGQTFESYAAKRFPRSVLGTTSQLIFMGQQVAIAYLWQQLQSIHGGNIGVLPPVYPAGFDTVIQLSIDGWDLSKSYMDLMDGVAQQPGGPDWTIGWTEDGNGLPLKQLIVGQPIGNPISATDLTLDYPGPISSYVYSENSSSGANSWWAVGDGSGSTTTTGSATDASYQTNGYPLIEGVNTYSGVTNQTTINAHATADLKAFDTPLVTHSVQLKADSMPPFGSYGMGDYLVFNATDPRFKNGITFTKRVIGWTIQPPDEGQGTEMILPVLDEPSAN